MIKKLLLALFVGIILIVGGFIAINNSVKPVSGDDSVHSFLITKGSSASQIGKNLQKEGLIKSSLAFKIYVQFTGRQSKISAGEFRLSPSQSLFEIVATLQKGPVEIWVTIPEGLRHEEIAQKFADELSKDNQFVNEFIALSSTHEGYLFPDTYLFPKSTTASKIVEKMLSTFDIRTKTGVTENQVIMASIIERETKGDAEKPVVAGILYKRIENEWPLQVDASIQYAKGDWKPILSSDKELNSSYNTYKFQGLPIGPISNPGIASINAAVNPTTSDYWYYLHDEKGVIHYGLDLDDHNANIRKYLW
ncbi:endolytic transglycosylase MltG [Candidatus Microgenomates bacterium]|nr:endolytic transglycosylase MltG [Candidatus Microgenomates bacterium]